VNPFLIDFDFFLLYASLLNAKSYKEKAGNKSSKK